MKFLPIYSLLGLLALAGVAQAENDTAGGLPAGFDQVFIGEWFASGKLYLDGWDEGGPSQSTAPQRIRFVAASNASAAGQAAYVRDQQNTYIPGLEGIDPNRDADCNTLDRSKNPHSGYFGTIIFDYCEPDPLVWSYQADHKPAAPLTILAVADTLRLGAADFSTTGQPRPLSPEEQTQVDAAKKAAQQKDTDCTTNRQFLDAAKQIMTVPVAGSDYRLRLSRYANTGCLGHLTDIYVVDILQQGRVLKRLERARYQGPI